jgi:hypothetical protein
MRRRPHLVPVAETNLVSRSIGERRRGAALTRERPWHKSVSRPTVVWTPCEFRLAESSGAHTCQLRHAGSAPAPVGRCSSARWNGAYSARNANAASLRRTPQSSRHWRSRQERRGVVKANDRGQRVRGRLHRRRLRARTQTAWSSFVSRTYPTNDSAAGARTQGPVWPVSHCERDEVYASRTNPEQFVSSKGVTPSGLGKLLGPLAHSARPRNESTIALACKRFRGARRMISASRRGGSGVGRMACGSCRSEVNPG